MRDPSYKGLSLYARFDKFHIEPNFDVVKLDRLVEIVNEYIDEIPIEEEIDVSKLSGIAYINSNSEKFTEYIFKTQKELAKGIRKKLKGEK